MNSLAALSKMEWSSSPMVVTDVIVFTDSMGEPPFSEAWVDYSECWKSSSLNGLSSLKVSSCLTSLSLCNRVSNWSLNVRIFLTVVYIVR